MKRIVHSKAIWITAVVAIVILAIGVSILVTGKSGNKKLKEQLSLGEQYFEDMNYGQARRAYEKALQIDNHNVEAYLGLAKVYEKVDNKDKELEVLQEGFDKTKDKQLQEKLDELKKEMKDQKDDQGSKKSNPTKEPEKIPAPNHGKEEYKGYIKKLESKEFKEAANVPKDFTKIIGDVKSPDATYVTVGLLDIDQNGVEELLFNTSRYKSDIYVYTFENGKVVYCGKLVSLENNLWEGDAFNYQEGPYILYYSKEKIIRTNSLDGNNMKYVDTYYGYELVGNQIQLKYKSTEKCDLKPGGNNIETWAVEDQEVSRDHYIAYNEKNLSNQGELVKFYPYEVFIKNYKVQ
ncbi:MAG: tetratricopeptide repeat protein [bacterium]|nr:tetratricopeptide repeat protein [bacterium]